jgi:hypothetical protein
MMAHKQILLAELHGSSDPVPTSPTASMGPNNHASNQGELSVAHSKALTLDLASSALPTSGELHQPSKKYPSTYLQDLCPCCFPRDEMKNLPRYMPFDTVTFSTSD